jgi:hypothetical protein
MNGTHHSYTPSAFVAVAARSSIRLQSDSAQSICLTDERVMPSRHGSRWCATRRKNALTRHSGRCAVGPRPSGRFIREFGTASPPSKDRFANISTFSSVTRMFAIPVDLRVPFHPDLRFRSSPRSVVGRRFPASGLLACEESLISCDCAFNYSEDGAKE